MPFAREGLAGAGGVLVGSRHTAESLWEAMGDPELPGRTRLGPPGVDVDRFTPREPAAARAGLEDLRERLAATGAPPRDDGSSFARRAGEAAEALGTVGPEDRLVVFVGKLIASKGVELLLAAWPLVLAREPAARLLIVGFGGFREGLEALAAQLAAGRPRRRPRHPRRGRAGAALAGRVPGRPGGRGGRRLPRGGARAGGPRGLRRPARPRRARRRAAGRRGDGRHEHVPRGVRHGRRRGRRLRRAAGGRAPLRPGGGRPHARRRGARTRARVAHLRGRPRRRRRARRRALGLARGPRGPARGDPRGDRRGDPRALLLGGRRPHRDRRRAGASWTTFPSPSAPYRHRSG